MILKWLKLTGGVLLLSTTKESASMKGTCAMAMPVNAEHL